MKRGFALLGFAAVACAAQSAEFIDTYPDWTGNVTNGWFKVAQSFEVDPINTTFQNLRFSLGPGNGDILVELYKFDANGPTGSALFNRIIARPAAGGQIYIPDAHTIMFPAGKYGFVVDMLGNNGPSVHFNVHQTSYNEGHAYFHDGTSWSAFTNLNLTFRAEFSALPEPGTMVAVGAGVVGLLARQRRVKR